MNYISRKPRAELLSVFSSLPRLLFRILAFPYVRFVAATVLVSHDGENSKIQNAVFSKRKMLRGLNKTGENIYF